MSSRRAHSYSMQAIGLVIYLGNRELTAGDTSMQPHYRHILMDTLLKPSATQVSADIICSQYCNWFPRGMQHIPHSICKALSTVCGYDRALDGTDRPTSLLAR